MSGFKYRHTDSALCPCDDCEAKRGAAAGIEEPPQFDPSKCGTYAGVSQHGKYALPLCDPCKAANREYARKRRHAKGESKGTWLYVADPHVEEAEEILKRHGIQTRRMATRC